MSSLKFNLDQLGFGFAFCPETVHMIMIAYFMLFVLREKADLRAAGDADQLHRPAGAGRRAAAGPLRLRAEPRGAAR